MMRGRVWIGLMFVLIGMIVLVGAEPAWNDSSNDDPYYFLEETTSFHNFTLNLSDLSDLSYFSILNISWVSGSLGPDHSDFYWFPWNDTGFSNSPLGIFKINSFHDNETGSFELNVHAQGNETGQSLKFDFIINATNDDPNFSLSSDYSVSIPGTGNTTKNISLVGSDEEEHYPLEYNVTFFACSPATWNPRYGGSNCNLTYEMDSQSNTTSVLALSNLTHDDVGVYNLTICAHDDFNATTLPLYRASDYDENKSVCYNTTLSLSSSLSIDVSNCTGQILNEDEEFNCTINVTTVDETDSVDVSSFAFFKNDSNSAENSSWFYSDATDSAVGFVLEIPISVTPRKQEVGNWTINFSVDDGTSVVVEEIDLFVNYSESVVSLDSVADLTGASAVYENMSFDLRGYDEDLLIRDGSVRDENLTYASNTSWVSVTSPSSAHLVNYTTSVVSIDHDSVVANVNYSVMINVTDLYGNSANQTFVIEVLNDTAPEWNSLDDPVALSLTEGVAFSYNVSLNISDAENDPISFYYENVSAEFCSLTASNFNSSGMINFTPVDCDVGYHNVTIIASDGKLNSSAKQFNFSVENVNDESAIFWFTGENGTQSDLDEGFNFVVSESVVVNFSLIVNDSDFLIPQEDYYNESLTIDVNATNSTGSEVELFDFSFESFASPHAESVEYDASFTPNVSHVGDYTIFVNITDASGSSINRTFYLNVSAVLNAPVLVEVDNQSVTIYDYLNFTASASDDEDDFNGLNLSYSILSLSAGAPNLTVGDATGIVEFNMSSNESYAGIWDYNLTVTDSDAQADVQTFYVYVYGNASLLLPSENAVFNLTENVTGVLNFTINHSIGDNLTYEFWVDSIGCGYQNSSNCSYGNFSLKESVVSSGNGSLYGWSFVPNYTDESYGNYKNLTVRVYPSAAGLNSSQQEDVAANFSFRLNVSHANAPLEIYEGIGSHSSTYGAASPVEISLTDHFRDYDYLDSYYLQNVTFVINSSASTTGITAESTLSGDSLPWSGLIDDWSLQLYATSALEETLTIMANDSFSTDTSVPFTVTFTEPSTVTVPSPSSSTTIKIKYFSLKLIVPQDVVFTDQTFIDVSFAVQNNGLVDLSGISLSSIVNLNNMFSDAVNISLEGDYIDELKVGQSKNFSMRIVADLNSPGRYKATLFANVTSPKFSDWADFFIEVRKANESEAEQLLIFTEKFIIENPECLELTELLNRAEEEFNAGNFSGSVAFAEQAIMACEEAIEINEQIRYKVDGFIQDNFYYIFFVTLVVLFAGFIFYVYKRVRFNKSIGDEYM